MQLFWSVDDVRNSMNGGALAIGNFDGVHRGHQALIAKAKQTSAITGVLTFTPHPATLLTKQQDYFLLTSDEQKIGLLAKFGVDVAIIHRIDAEFLRLSPEAFIDDILVKQLQVGHVIVGSDFAFGHQAAGDINMLLSLAQTRGFAVFVVDPVTKDGHRVSSTRIRQHLQNGELDAATKMLGRAFSLRGLIKSGQQRGAGLGFKTANIVPDKGFLLKRGVYATVARMFEGAQYRDFVSVTNVGVRPTISNEKILVVETHCLDQELHLY